MIDFEGDHRSGVVEFGVVLLRGGVITDTRTRLCRAASGDIRQQAFLLHGIRSEDTTHCAPFADEWEYFRALRRAGPLGAHHASVEHGLLKRVWPYPGTVPDFIRPGATVTDWGPWLDTRAIYQAVFPDLPSHALGDLVTAFGLQHDLDRAARAHCPKNRCRYHCALYDTLASALLLLALASRPQFHALSVEWLLEFSATGQRGRARARQDQLPI